MNKIKSKKVHIAIVVMALLFLTGGYFAHSFMGWRREAGCQPIHKKERCVRHYEKS